MSNKFEIGKEYYGKSVGGTGFRYRVVKINVEKARIQFQTEDCYGNSYKFTTDYNSHKGGEEAVDQDVLIRSEWEIPTIKHLNKTH